MKPKLTTAIATKMVDRIEALHAQIDDVYAEATQQYAGSGNSNVIRDAVKGEESLLVLIGIAISTQPLLYGMTRQLVDAQNAGKALSAINLAFFLGTALMQSTTGVVATIFGLPAVLLFMAATLIVGTIVFLMYT